MGCEVIYENGKAVGFACSRGRQPRPKCYICGKSATALCDHSDYGLGAQRVLKTCDRPMCNEHRHRVGKDTDYCDEHYEVYKDDEFRRRKEQKNSEPEQLKFQLIPVSI